MVIGGRCRRATVTRSPRMTKSKKKTFFQEEEKNKRKSVRGKHRNNRGLPGRAGSLLFFAPPPPRRTRLPSMATTAASSLDPQSSKFKRKAVRQSRVAVTALTARLVVASSEIERIRATRGGTRRGAGGRRNRPVTEMKAVLKFFFYVRR